MSDTTTLPPTGIYPGIPFAEYRRWPAVNKSLLDPMYEYSAFHCDYWSKHRKPETRSMRLGHALHSLVLEPGDFDKSVIVIGQCEGITQKGSRCSKRGQVARGGKVYCEMHDPGGDNVDGRTVVSVDDMAEVRLMRESLMAHPLCGGFIESEGQNELSIIWIDRATELPCKARIDMARLDSWGAIGDLKTTACAKPSEFERSVSNYGYQRQAAWYMDGWAAVTGKPADMFLFVAVENDEPYAACAFEMGGTSLAIGREQNRLLLSRYAECRRTGRWPGYGDDEFITIEMDQFSLRRAMQENLQASAATANT